MIFLPASIKNVNFYKGDIFQKTTKNKIKDFFDGKLEVIISDMAANTTGNKSLDSIRTNQLCLEILNLSSKTLVSNGVFVSKVFMGEDFDEIINKLKLYLKRWNSLNLCLAGMSQKKLIYIVKF